MVFFNHSNFKVCGSQLPEFPQPETLFRTRMWDVTLHMTTKQFVVFGDVLQTAKLVLQNMSCGERIQTVIKYLLAITNLALQNTVCGSLLFLWRDFFPLRLLDESLDSRALVLRGKDTFLFCYLKINNNLRMSLEVPNLAWTSNVFIFILSSLLFLFI